MGGSRGGWIGSSCGSHSLTNSPGSSTFNFFFENNQLSYFSFFLFKPPIYNDFELDIPKKPKGLEMMQTDHQWLQRLQKCHELEHTHGSKIQVITTPFGTTPGENPTSLPETYEPTPRICRQAEAETERIISSCVHLVILGHKSRQSFPLCNDFWGGFGFWEQK